MVFCAVAQKATFEFFSTKDGLAGNNTGSVAQDDQGFLWFVNNGKLHRYDGRNFIVYPSAPDLPNNQEFVDLASWQDSLLFLWSDHFAFLFNPKTGIWQQTTLMDGNAQNEKPRLWQRFSQNKILLDGVNKGFREVRIWQLINNRLEQIRLPEHLPALKGGPFWSDIDASGYTYLAYRDTLFQLDPSGAILNVTPMGNICSNCYNLCFSFAADGTLILLANWKFYILDRGKNKFVPHPASRFLKTGQNHLHRFILEKNGSIWACGENRNLVFYDALKDTLYNFHEELKALLPNPNDFKGLFQDKTGVVWVNTRLGLLKVKPLAFPFENYINEQNQSNAYYSFRGFTEDPFGMIYGVYYDGIAKFDPTKKQASKLYTFKNILNFFDLYPEGDKIWANSGELFDPKSGALIQVPSLFHEHRVGDNGFFSKDKNGILWWAAHYHLYYLDKSENDFRWIMAFEFPEKNFNKLMALHAGLQSGKLWASFNGKLLQYDPMTKEQRWYNPADWGTGLSRIMVIEEDKGGKLWLATDAGLLYFDPVLKENPSETSKNGLLKHFTVNNGLPNNFICGILTEGDSCLWLSTNNGLSRLHIPTQYFINFFETDGLTHNEFNRKSYYKARDGRMFFGGMRGVNGFFPEAIMRAYQNKTKGARLVLSAFEYTDERRDTILRETMFSATPEIRLHHWDWSYTFEYALTDYNNPKEVFYSYMMEGYKDSWSAPSKFNFTRFNNLPAGKYVFRVKARDSQGRWLPSQLAVNVIVYPPWWATWWAYTLYALSLVTLVYFLRRYELNRQILKSNLKVEKLEAEKLKELDHFKSRLYTNLTHEFRTPLTVILGMVGQIRSEPKKYLDEGARLIETNGQNLLRLINQLLDLSKLENNAFQLHLERGDIVPYLRYVTESFQTYANQKNLSLRFFATLESLEMDYDPEQIKQVLTNLISNAVKFTPSGREVAVRLRGNFSGHGHGNFPGLQDLESLEIAVSDTGIGISEKDLPHIFDRFYQVDDSHTRRSEGTGIGLAHTQELVKAMGGEISVESEIGKGSVFMVKLPVTKNAPIKDRMPPVHPAYSTNLDSLNVENLGTLPETRHASRISHNAALPQLLIIEDNPDVVVYIKSCLEGLYQLDVAYNGEIGIEKALKNIPDIIISDVMMPGKDGFQVCDTLKNDERSSHIPIILLTAKADAASKLSGLRRGADAYLTKPFDKEELLVRLEMLVERQKRMAAYFSKNLLTAISNETEEAIQVEDIFMQKLRQLVEDNYGDENFALPELCKKIGMSRSQLFRKMQAVSNTSPSDFIRSYRLVKAKTLLETTDLSVSEVAWQVGYKDVAHFSKSYLETFGISPRASRK